eukprot:11754698-Alexandrium_andersonii.AAC.1
MLLLLIVACCFSKRTETVHPTAPAAQAFHIPRPQPPAPPPQAAEPLLGVRPRGSGTIYMTERGG